MRQLRNDTHLILGGEVLMYWREHCKQWQEAFVIDGQTTIRPAKAPYSTSGAKNEKYLRAPSSRTPQKDPMHANFVAKNCLAFIALALFEIINGYNMKAIRIPQRSLARRTCPFG
jgi:hypothetical protein